MGSRRAHEEAAVAAARAAVVAGFAGTSNLEAGRRYGLATIGTAAHAFTLLHDDEASAFAAQVASLGAGTTLLVDTYDVRRGRRARARGGGHGARRGPARLRRPGGARARGPRAARRGRCAGSTKIIVTSDLDEYAIAALAVAPVDAYGVGHVGGHRLRARRRAGWSTSSSPARAPTGVLAAGGEGRPGARSASGAARRRHGGWAPTVGPSRRCWSRVPTTTSGRWVSDDASLRALHVPLVTDGAVDPRWIGRRRRCAGQQDGTAPRATSCRAGRDGCRTTRQRCRPWRCGSGTEGPEPQRRHCGLRRVLDPRAAPADEPEDQADDEHDRRRSR